MFSMNTTDIFDNIFDSVYDDVSDDISNDISSECGYGCKHMVAAMDRVTSRMCESKETTTHVVIIITILLIIQIVMLIGLCVYTMRRANSFRSCASIVKYYRRYRRKDDVKNKLVSDRTVAEMDDAEL